MTTSNITGTNTAGSARTRRLTKKQADFPRLSFKARVDLCVIFWPVGDCICIGTRESHTIFAHGIWWYVVDRNGGLK